MECQTLRSSLERRAKSGETTDVIEDEEAHLFGCRSCIRWLFLRYGPLCVFSVKGRAVDDETVQECLSCRVGLLAFVEDHYLFPWDLHVNFCPRCQNLVAMTEALLRIRTPSDEVSWKARIRDMTLVVRRLPDDQRHRLLMLDLQDDVQKHLVPMST